MKTIIKLALLRLCAPLICLAAPATASAQHVFASTQSATLPTAANCMDNLEFNTRFAGLALDAATVPVEFAMQSGVAWNLQEIRTRGHSFKLVVTNQHQMNPTHTLAGAAEDFLDPGSWRFGFNIQRTVRF